MNGITRVQLSGTLLQKCTNVKGNINMSKKINLSSKKSLPGIEVVKTKDVHSAQDHKDAPKTLNVNWENHNTGTIFIRDAEDNGKYGICLAVEKYPIELPDSKLKSLMAKKYRKEGKLGLSVMIAHNQSEFDDIQSKFANEE